MRRSANIGQALALALVTLASAGCRFPGKPGPDHVPTRPDEVTKFEALYQRNCQACHGKDGRNGMAVSLGNPAYIAYAGPRHIAEITANGIGGSLMPAFATNTGGSLTDQQIQILADVIVSGWGNPGALQGAAPPPYESHATGDAAAGQALYRSDCLRCHAAGAKSILDSNYVALVSNGGLRTLIVAGKPAEGMPDWRGYPGGPLQDQQIADLVAFMVSYRTPAPGQPFPNAQGASQPGNAAAMAAAAKAQSQTATQAGPATGGPKVSHSPLPTNKPKHPTSLEP